jgi:hypothetical protein
MTGRPCSEAAVVVVVAMEAVVVTKRERAVATVEVAMEVVAVAAVEAAEVVEEEGAVAVAVAHERPMVVEGRAPAVVAAAVVTAGVEASREVAGALGYRTVASRLRS